MISLHPEQLVDEGKHTKAVLLLFSEWKEVLTELEELDDMRAYDDAKRENET